MTGVPPYIYLLSSVRVAHGKKVGKHWPRADKEKWAKEG